MPLPLANRFVHFEMDVSVDDWREWAFKSSLDERVISYITYKNEHLFTFDAKSDTKSFATPRSWEFVHKILQSDVKESELLETISGAVGRDVAVSFLSFIKVMNRLPNMQNILETSKGEYSNEISVLYALSTGLVSKLLNSYSDEKLDNLLTYTMELKSEFAVMIVQDLQRGGITMEGSDMFKEWVKKFAYLLA